MWQVGLKTTLMMQFLLLCLAVRFVCGSSPGGRAAVSERGWELRWTSLESSTECSRWLLHSTRWCLGKWSHGTVGSVSTKSISIVSTKLFNKFNLFYCNLPLKIKLSIHYIFFLKLSYKKYLKKKVYYWGIKKYLKGGLHIGFTDLISLTFIVLVTCH